MTKLYDSSGFQIIQKRIVYYAEIGVMDGGARGYWESTRSSVRCTSLEDAEQQLTNQGCVSQSDGRRVTWIAPKDGPDMGFAMARIRREEEDL